MAIAIVGIDLGKNSCSVAGLDGSGRGGAAAAPVARRSWPSSWAGCRPAWWRWRRAAARITSGGVFAAQGHEVRLMSPEYVQPYVKAQKNDDRDAEAIAEAATRPTMRFVALKSEAQLDMQTLHRARSRLVNEPHAADQPAAGDPARARASRWRKGRRALGRCAGAAARRRGDPG